MKKHYPSLLLTSAFLLVLNAHKGVSQSANDPYKKGKVEQVQTKEMPHVVSIHEEAFSLPIAEPYTILHEVTTDGERYHPVVELVKAGKAKIEKLIVVRTKSGQRSVNESTNEIRYPVEFGPPSLDSSSAKLQRANDARHRAFVEAEEAKKLG